MRSDDDSTHLTDGEGDDMYDECSELTREQFDAMFSADLDASDDDFGRFKPVLELRGGLGGPGPLSLYVGPLKCCPKLGSKGAQLWPPQFFLENL